MLSPATVKDAKNQCYQAYVLCLVSVTPEWERCGIACRMVEAAIDHLKADNYDFLLVDGVNEDFWMKYHGDYMGKTNLPCHFGGDAKSYAKHAAQFVVKPLSKSGEKLLKSKDLAMCQVTIECSSVRKFYSNL